MLNQYEQDSDAPVNQGENGVNQDHTEHLAEATPALSTAPPLEQEPEGQTVRESLEDDTLQGCIRKFDESKALLLMTADNVRKALIELLRKLEQQKQLIEKKKLDCHFLKEQLIAQGALNSSFNGGDLDSEESIQAQLVSHRHYLSDNYYTSLKEKADTLLLYIERDEHNIPQLIADIESEAKQAKNYIVYIFHLKALKQKYSEIKIMQDNCKQLEEKIAIERRGLRRLADFL